ncbi:hypothetical protein AC579_1072 [Pseudocercospora musae]|uniref:Uncharacterized protein n=1 Tax=Pseudocercospora musae TaxID=113226 RepID=A0A139H784_9PEZI|nr:hypothetical protein AC579_1072 [Pseudocercospora musae]
MDMNTGMGGFSLEHGSSTIGSIDAIFDESTPFSYIEDSNFGGNTFFDLFDTIREFLAHVSKPKGSAEPNSPPPASSSSSPTPLPRPPIVPSQPAVPSQAGVSSFPLFSIADLYSYSPDTAMSDIDMDDAVSFFGPDWNGENLPIPTPPTKPRRKKTGSEVFVGKDEQWAKRSNARLQESMMKKKNASDIACGFGGEEGGGIPASDSPTMMATPTPTSKVWKVGKKPYTGRKKKSKGGKGKASEVGVVMSSRKYQDLMPKLA